jgi:electron transfer flavoprotein alpha subunit
MSNENDGTNEGNVGINVGAYTVADLENELKEIEDPRVLEGMLEAEQDGKQRKSAQEAIRKRMGTLSPDKEDVEADSEPKEGKYRENADELALDPADHEIADLGPALQNVADPDELRAIRDAEAEGDNRDPVLTLLDSRIEKAEAALEEENSDEEDDLDIAAMSVADVANAIRGIDEPDELRELLDREEAGEDRDPVKKQIKNRLDSVEADDEEGVEERLPPEEKHPHLDHPTTDKQYVKALEEGEYRDMWVYCETQAGELIDVSLEMLGKARELMDAYNDDYDTDERVVAVLIGDDVARHAETCIANGADVAVYHEDSRLERFQHKAYSQLFCDMARWGGAPLEGEGPEEADWRDYDEPRYTIFPATNNGRDLSAQVQAELDSGLASDCSGLYIEESVISNPVKTGRPGSKKEFERVLHMKRPDFSGFEYSTILCLDNPAREFHPQGASVIPGSFDLPEPDGDREGEIVEHDLAIDDSWLRVSVTDHDRIDEGVDLSGREVIVCMGRGIGDDPTRGMELGLELADAFGDADIGVTRGIVTGSYEFDGHVEQYTAEDRQIGETGQVVEPDLYIAAGVSGAVQHKVGMDNSETVVAINTDSDARIRDFTDFFVEGDLFDVLPRLTKALETGDMDVEAIAADGGRPGDARPDGGRPANGERGGDDDSDERSGDERDDDDRGATGGEQ